MLVMQGANPYPYINKIYNLLGKLVLSMQEINKDINNDDISEGFYDDIGGYHEAGMGWNPNGNWCGECSTVNCRECPNMALTK